MSRRLAWFAAGAAAGMAGATYGRRKAKQAAEKLAPSNVARSAGTRVRARAHDVTEAVREGRRAAKAKEAELKAERARAEGVDPADPLEALTTAGPGGTTVNYIVVTTDKDAAEVLPTIGRQGGVPVSARDHRRRGRR